MHESQVSVEKREKDGLHWVLGAGLFALFMIAVLSTSDRYLSEGSFEKRHQEELRELRTAQSGFDTSVVEPRQALGH